MAAGPIFVLIKKPIDISRTRRTILSLLALGALIVGCGSVSSASSDTSAQAPPVSNGAPVVEVVFDELPTATLMNSSGTGIDGKRFPGFAELAAHSTWYRNNTTVADFTGRAVPAIETGNNPDKSTLPTYKQQPHSIFTLLGGRYRFNVTEPVTQLCPPSLCKKGAKRQQPPLPGAAGTAGGSVNSRITAGHFAQDLFVPPKPGEFQHFVARIRPGDRSFNFIHFEVPHEPFHFLPDGRSYNYTPISDVGSANAERWAGGIGGTATTWQRHYIQTAYADRLTTLLIKRLKKVGIWQKALVIVTADHGISFDPKTFRRIAEPAAFGGIANPPLFIKYPGQTQGQVSDLHSRTIDIVPTTAQVLGIDLPYKTEGVPISDDGTEGAVTILNGFNQEVSAPLSTLLTERDAVLRRAAQDLGAHTGLFALGPRSDLLGRHAPGGSGRGAALDSRLDYGHVVLGAGRKVPAFVDGTARGNLAGHVFAIALNGRIVATCRAFRFKGRTRWGAVVPPSTVHPGSNSVGVYLVRANRLVRLGGT
jgi:Sulfatase